MLIGLYTLGCKLNQAESRILEEDLERNDLTVVSWPSEAPLYIVNACSVTAKAEHETRQIVSQIKRKFPKSHLLVTGCFIDSNNKLVDDWEHNKKRVVQHCLEVGRRKMARRSDSQSRLGINKKRTRFFIKIQDGCNKFCAYCLVPYLRGRSRGRPPKEILDEIKKCERRGVKEIVLVGTNIGEYQYKLKTQNSKFKIQNSPKKSLRLPAGQAKIKNFGLVGLLKMILAETNILRIRLSSLWPSKITRDLLELFKNNLRLCPHFHLSIQSASDRILKLMGRDYNRKQLEKIINEIKKVPDAILTADFIIGFPGETSKEFQETYHFVQKHLFFRPHIFRYSIRPRTKAGVMAGQIANRLKKRRSQKLISLAKKISKNLRKKFLGKNYLVLFEEKVGEFWQGLTPNYLKVFVRNNKDLKNQIYQVNLVSLFKDGAKGRITH